MWENPAKPTMTTPSSIATNACMLALRDADIVVVWECPGAEGD